MAKIIVYKNEFDTDHTGTSGRRLGEKVEDANIFEINTTTIEWMDCSDNVNAADWFYVEGVGFQQKVRKPYIHPVTGEEHPWDWVEPS